MVRTLGIEALDLGFLHEPALDRDSRIRSRKASAARPGMEGAAVVLAEANHESAESRICVGNSSKRACRALSSWDAGAR
jgi:hypothetical protein